MAAWQVDIPGLSQLVLSAGAQGLKQLALAGVDNRMHADGQRVGTSFAELSADLERP